MNNTLEEILSAGINIAHQAGKIASDWAHQRQDLTIERKGHQDWVSQADREVESYIFAELKRIYPQHCLYGEEQGGDNCPPCWMIDPIDGTTNYLYGMADFVVSMAYADEQGPAVGIIYAPAHGRTIYAVRGKGAYEIINGNPNALKPRGIDRDELVVGLNLNFKPGVARQYLSHSQQLIECGHQIRVSGSAAWTLVQTACGELDGCYLGHVYCWDVLAAQLICKEAGLMSSSFVTAAGPAWAFPYRSRLLSDLGLSGALL